MLLCCFIIKACGSPVDELHAGRIHKRNTAEGSSQETAPFVSSNDSESGDASLYQDAPEDEEDGEEDDSEASSEVHSSADDHDIAENATETERYDEDIEDDWDENENEN